MECVDECDGLTAEPSVKTLFVGVKPNLRELLSEAGSLELNV